MSGEDEEPADAADGDAESGADGTDEGTAPEVADEETPAEEAPVEDDDAGPSLEEALAAAAEAIEGDSVDEAALSSALDAIEDATAAAQTEADLDEVEAAIEDVESALEAADLPEPEDEDEAGPREALEGRIEAVHEAVEEARGPYAEDVVEATEAAATTVTGADWTETGETEAAEAVDAFLDSVADVLDADLPAAEGDVEELAAALEAAAAAVSDADLDADGDAETIAALAEAADALTADLDAAEEWDDLSTREQLEAQGFYDVLGHHKDYPPEWSALKEHEKRGTAEMVLLALESLGSEFMEEHCLEALRRMAPEAAIDPMLERADRRDRDGIEILGKIGAEEAVETIVEYVDTDSDPQLQKTTLTALGEIGSEEATQAVANKLVTENERVRSHAARALGMIGDTRAIEPLADVLEGDDSDVVRGSAAWALVQIGTEAALEAAGEHVDDSAYLVAAEAEAAAEALGARPA